MKQVEAAICIPWRDQTKFEVALIQRRTDYPHQLSGQWFLPGGGVESDEEPEVTAVRETEEECGLIVVEPQLVDCYDYTERWHDEQGEVREQQVILSVFQAMYASGELGISNETQDAAWIPRSEVGNYITDETKQSHLSTTVRSLLYG